MNWTILVQLAANLLPSILPSGEQWVTQALSAVMAYDPNTTKWVQGELNSFLGLNPPLKVDGVWGPKTTAAVKQAETRLGIQANGALSNLLISGLQAAVKAVPTL